VADRQLVDSSIAAESYLVTPSWLAKWREQIGAMGFAAEHAGAFFHDFAKGLVLLDTGIDDEAGAHLAELSDVLNLPVRRIPVGLDHTRLLLTRLVLEWRLDQEHQASAERNRKHANELADNIAAMDMLMRLAKTQHEEDAVATIKDLLRMLFAPAALHYLRVENEIAISREPIPKAMRLALDNLSDDYAWTPDGLGFLLRIGRGEKTLGLVAVDQLTFPAYRERYLNLALTVTGVCALAIENARNRQRLLEAEKMASLGILIAGVAHEINTPLGVGLAAASALQEQSSHLAARFSTHSMTQSDLQQYFESAGSGTDLIRRNLERIGHLIDAFRQVAVEGTPLATQPFRLRDCIDNVVLSLGKRLPTERIVLNIECEPTLEIIGTPSDWVSIFVNLIGNSLKHGFKGHARGCIDICVNADGKRLRVDYRDDGVGLAAGAVNRVFDPFFTTDLQQGMGLGMHLVYNLVTQRLGGNIQCENQPGQGVRFHIDIPLATQSEAAQ
jgi:signal transduction histidine kinase